MVTGVISRPSWERGIAGALCSKQAEGDRYPAGDKPRPKSEYTGAPCHEHTAQIHYPKILNTLLTFFVIAKNSQGKETG